ncbi:cytochrome c-551 [Ferrigenium kumadai]|uniref:Cytochrome c-551 n=2 Tax=Ferrigenium kumadai TaxID=1682490 RepID=A0AAN1W039_9PROT|nr:cytochrome c-551 [Ferrigenium kumadai]
MRKIQLMTSMLVAGVVYAGGAMAADADGGALLKKNNCLACHAIDKKVVGPSYKDVAAKYRGQADAEAQLIAKVTKGGKGAWGSMPMPPQTAKADEVKTMVQYILSQK